MKKNVIIFIETLFMVLQISFLDYSDSYNLIYILLFVAGFLFLNINKNSNIYEAFLRDRRMHRIVVMFAFLFSVLISASNYRIVVTDLFTPHFSTVIFEHIFRLVILLSITLGTFFVFYNILGYIVVFADFSCVKKLNGRVAKPRRFFLFSFMLISIIDLLVLFICKYPGNITSDSFAQIAQIYTSQYYNDNPFYHTILIQFFFKIGMILFGEVNAAIATYVTFQIIFMSFCFSYVLVTLYKMQINEKLLFAVLLFYAMMPYHIMLGLTVWKDVPFGGCVLLFCTSFYRYVQKLGTVSIDFLFLILSSFGICLFRSNGLFAFVIATIVFGFLYRFRNIKVLIIMCVTIICTFFMKHALLDSMNVVQPDLVEAMNIPEQQIARVIYDGGYITDEQMKLLETVIDIEEAKAQYDWRISNPIKILVREKGNQQYILDNKIEFIKAYISIGINNPWSYMKSWIDGTKGYWNGGYSYWRWADVVSENKYGIERIKLSSTIDTIFNEYLWLFENMPILQLLLSIGLFVWLIILSLFLGVVYKRKDIIFISVILLAVDVSLLVATPVYSEFRYAYAFFCVMPFVLIAALYEKDSEVNISE